MVPPRRFLPEDRVSDNLLESQKAEQRANEQNLQVAPVAPEVTSQDEEEYNRWCRDEAFEAGKSEDELAAEEHFAYEAHQERLARARRRLSSVGQLVRMNHPERNFLIGPKLLPRSGRMLITGMSGTGKSTLTLYLAACLSSRQPLFGIVNTHKDEKYGEPKFPVLEQSVVFYLDYELPDAIRAEERLKPLVEQFPKEFQDNVFFPPHPSLYRLHNQVGEHEGKGSFDALKTLVGAVRPDVIIIDPLSSSHSLDENSIAVKQALNNVDTLIDMYGCAVIVVHHATTKVRRDGDGKPIEKEAIEQPRGHSSLMDWCDVHIHFAGQADDDEEEEEARDTRTIKMSFGKSRYCKRPEKRRLQVEFSRMRVHPMQKNKS